MLKSSQNFREPCHYHSSSKKSQVFAAKHPTSSVTYTARKVYPLENLSKATKLDENPMASSTFFVEPRWR